MCSLLVVFVDSVWKVRGQCVVGACNYTRVKFTDLVVTCICMLFLTRTPEV